MANKPKRSRVKVSLLLTGVAALTVATGGSPVQAATLPTTDSTTTGPDWTYPASAATLADTAKIIRADVAYKQGFTGKGVGIALIDTGVLPVQGLTSGNIVNGPDLSLESQVPALRNKDTYGHGTHMAGIIAGRDNTTGTGFRGIAPDAKLTSIKVATANGSVDVTQVMAAIDWVVKHRNDDPANKIRVINLSYGTDSTQLSDSDPLAAAVDNANNAGITVVIAAGNAGAGGKLTNPSIAQVALSVGSSDGNGTTKPNDDIISAYSTQGINPASNRQIDFTAPGRSIVSLRAPGSYADVNFPTALVGDRFFKGSGTSQAAAVTSGAVALLLQKYPNLAPRDVRSHLTDKTSYWTAGYVVGGGTGVLNVGRAFESAPSGGMALGPLVTANGTIQRARGTAGGPTFSLDAAKLTGERDIFGPLSVSAWYKASKAGTSWSGGSWMGHTWTGTAMGPVVDGQATWTGATWAGTSWTGRYWTDVAWSAAAWNGRYWTNTTAFNGRYWTGVAWQASGWLNSVAGAQWMV